jgi:hypothetical protein
MKTGLPLLLSTPFIPAMNVAVWFAWSPMRMVLASAEIPWFPISMLESPVVRLKPAELPKAMFPLPVVLMSAA